MTDTKELDALIIQNIGDIEAAMTRALELDARLIEEIGALVKARFGSDWHVHADADQSNLWFARRAWLTDDGNDADYCVALVESAGAGGTDRTWLADLLGTGPNGATAGFQFDSNTMLKSKRWKTLLVEQKLQIQAMQDTGLMALDGRPLFSPITLDTISLAAGFEEDDLADAFAPVNAALDIIERALSSFDALVAADQQL